MRRKRGSFKCKWTYPPCRVVFRRRECRCASWPRKRMRVRVSNSARAGERKTARAGEGLGPLHYTDTPAASFAVHVQLLCCGHHGFVGSSTNGQARSCTAGRVAVGCEATTTYLQGTRGEQKSAMLQVFRGSKTCPKSCSRSASSGNHLHNSWSGQSWSSNMYSALAC